MSTLTGTAAGTTARPTALQLGRYFALRVGGLPHATVESLRCPDSTAFAAALVASEQALAADADRIGEILHQLIGANDEATSRRPLLALRRKIFQGKAPADPDAAIAAVAALDLAAAQQVQGWLDQRRALDDQVPGLARRLAGELTATRNQLRQLATDPVLRAGVQIASPALDEQLLGLERGTSTVPAKKLRRIERSVLSYLYRTACKTSPFSTFTPIGIGTFDPLAAAEIAGPADDLTQETAASGSDQHSQARLNIVVISRIVEAICDHPDRRDDLPVVLSPGLRQDPERLRYVRRWVTQGDDAAAVSFDAVQDGLFYLRRSGLLDGLVTLLADGSALRYVELIQWLQRQTPATVEQCQEYLSILLRLDILQIDGFAVDVHTADPLRRLQDVLGRFRRPWAEDLAARLDEPISLIAAFAGGDLEQRRAALRELRESLLRTQSWLGAGTGSLPQALVYEDCHRGDVATAPPARWDRITDDLAAVEAVLPAFDMTLPHRITFHGFFLARYGSGGRCDDLLRLVEDFHDDLYDQYLTVTSDRRPFGEDGTYQAEENWLGRPELSRLDAVRQELATYVAETLARSSPADRDTVADEILLDHDDLHRIGNGLDRLYSSFRPQSHLLQVARRDQGPLAVLNQSLGGLSFPFSRFTHGWHDSGRHLTAGLRAQARELAPRGGVFAEVTGGPATTNLNLHTQLTDWVIVCPGETSTVDPARQLPLADLSLQHDVVTDRVLLYSRRLGREVVPVYLGYLMPMALPQLHRALLLLSPTSLSAIDLWRGVPEPPAVDGVVSRPRVRVGDTVVSRRSWSLSVEALPLRSDGQSDADWFLAWQRWLHRHRLPTCLFATVHSGGGRPKPQYLDGSSFLSLQVFEALIGGPTDRVVLREMLPAGDELPADGHVTEMVVETFPECEGCDR